MVSSQLWQLSAKLSCPFWGHLKSSQASPYFKGLGDTFELLIGCASLIYAFAWKTKCFQQSFSLCRYMYSHNQPWMRDLDWNFVFHDTDILEQGSANFSYKGKDSEYFRLCDPVGLCCHYSTQPPQNKGNHDTM